VTAGALADACRVQSRLDPAVRNHIWVCCHKISKGQNKRPVYVDSSVFCRYDDSRKPGMPKKLQVYSNVCLSLDLITNTTEQLCSIPAICLRDKRTSLKTRIRSSSARLASVEDGGEFGIWKMFFVPPPLSSHVQSEWSDL